MSDSLRVTLVVWHDEADRLRAALDAASAETEEA